MSKDRTDLVMADESSTSSFGPIHVVEPTNAHTHTAVLLHGRGSTGEEFAEELAESLLSNKKSLMQTFPGYKWVFPSSREIWSTVFEETMPAWFEAHSLTDIMARQDLQMEGIRESVNCIEKIVVSEIDNLGGYASRVVLGGISQGGAVGIWTLLSMTSKLPGIRPGAFVGASAWLPFASNIVRKLQNAQQGQEDDFVQSMLPLLTKNKSPVPVFLGHGLDDAYVDVELGRQARQVLSQAGFSVDWREYSGAEQEGHWVKAPEQLDDVAHFLQHMLEARRGEYSMRDRVGD